MRILVLGEYLGEAVGLLDHVGKLLGQTRRDAPPGDRHPECSMPRPSWLGDLPGDGHLVSGNHLDGDAHLRWRLRWSLANRSGADRKGQHTQEAPMPLVIGAGHAERPKSPYRESIDGLIDRVLHLGRVRRQCQDDLGAPLVTLNVPPSVSRTVASVRLPTGSNG